MILLHALQREKILQRISTDGRHISVEAIYVVRAMSYLYIGVWSFQILVKLQK